MGTTPSDDELLILRACRVASGLSVVSIVITSVIYALILYDIESYVNRYTEQSQLFKVGDFFLKELPERSRDLSEHPLPTRQFL